MEKDLAHAIADLEEKEALDMARNRLESGEDPLKILDETRAATEIVGKRFADGEYYIPDLIYSGEILKSIVETVKPKLPKTQIKHQGAVVVGTVSGDIHNIGKDILIFLLEANGFQVHDLGVDVPAEKFIHKIAETGATIVGLSGLLTLAYDSMKNTIDSIAAAGLKNKVKIMIGGGLINDQVRKYTGADAFGKDAMEGVAIAKQWSEGTHYG